MTFRLEVAEAEQEKRAAACRMQLEEANRRVFERECKEEGIDIAKGYSPALLKTLRQPS